MFHQFEQLVGRVSCRKPVAHVALVGEARKFDDPQIAGPPNQAIRNVLDVTTASLVSVRDDGESVTC